MSAQSNPDKPVPSIDEVLQDLTASWWLRSSLLSALSRDPVDAANDAEVLACLLDRRCHDLLTTQREPQHTSGSLVGGGSHENPTKAE